MGNVGLRTRSCNSNRSRFMLNALGVHICPLDWPVNEPAVEQVELARLAQGRGHPRGRYHTLARQTLVWVFVDANNHPNDG